ncbi:calcium-binding protein [Antarctobacter jejuensis]|uniref:calcium-binding protein n=1 Tax=Antarctobacter jejuensis TaxID=1439938 RepID=UPI003FD5CD3B
MASFTLTGFSSAARTLTAAEFGIVTKDAELVVTTGDAITADGSHFLTLNGTVLAHSSSSYNALDFDGDSVNLFIGPDGFVSAANGDTLSINATGAVRIQNAGTLMSGEDAVDVRDTDGAINVSMSNSGTIIGESDGVNLDGGTASISLVNTGTIMGQEGYGVYMNWQSGSTGATLLRNTGTITGDNGSFNASAGTGVNTIINDGVMNGNIYLDNGNDVYQGGGGRVSGTVYGDEDNDLLAGGAFSDNFDGGSGDDTLLGRGGDDILDGSSGNDFILGGDGNDEIEGGSNDDTLNANSGDDTILGQGGNDILVGQDGSDYLEGGPENDTMDGGNGDDTLEGGDDNDILRGRAGEDELAGGLGRDYLTGGQGADSFVFRSTADAGIGANRDQILDFEQGVDVIIVAGLSPGVFEFRGTAAFAPSGNPELRLNETATGSTIVQIDNNGDGVIDAEIRVGGVTGLTADDFVL